MINHTDITYSKLPGKKRKLIGKNTAWMGPDHLLVVESSGISENYKRLYFKDIQAINILKTPHALIINSVLLVLMAGFAAAGLVLYDSPVYPVSVVLWIIAGVMLVYFIRNAPQGASCEFWLSTRVQTEKLTSVHTIRTLKKAMNILVPAIERSQGRLAAESLPLVIKRLHTRSGKEKYHPAGTEKVTMPRVWHQVLFAMAVVSGCLIAVSIVYHPPLLLAIGVLWILGCFAVAVIAISVQVGKKAHGMVKAGSWIIAFVLLFTLVAGYVEGVVYYIRHITEISTFESYNQWEMMKIYARINPVENPFILGITLFEAVSLILSGLAGGYFLIRHPDQSL